MPCPCPLSSRLELNGMSSYYHSLSSFPGNSFLRSNLGKGIVSPSILIQFTGNPDLSNHQSSVESINLVP
jgi:hypothetical protein